jgi:ribosomal protection tetracycline resistance protein
LRTLNLGILAHVDAGKTSLTERLLHTAGVIDEIGSVDDGNTQTDSMDLERQRGITIKSAVVSFPIDDVTVNLIDTPGHPDFIAEVERVLSVLDGAVLVVSAVEGVQAQTRVLMRTLRRLRIPTLVFVNKIDRRGADPVAVLESVAARLTPAVVRVSGVDLLERLAEHDDALLSAYAYGHAVPSDKLTKALADQTARCLVHPAYFGSAITGAGVDALIEGIRDLLPSSSGAAEGPVSGSVFKVERGPAGEKIAYIRMRTGTLHVREKATAQKVTAIQVFDSGTAVAAQSVAAGRIAKLWGLSDIRIGDAVGVPEQSTVEHHFAPPTLETVVVPARAADRGALHVALTQLAEQDPLINHRQDSVSLYGEVQKEVIQATLANDFGLDVTFRETTTIHIERVLGTGTSEELIGTDENPFLATVGLRVEPGPPGSGVGFRLGVELGSMPYSFFKAVEETVHETLQQGLRGWQVLDCVVTMTRSGYYARQSHSHGVFDKSMSSTAGDFRNLTPLVLMDALRRAGTEVLEPLHRFRLEIPPDTFGALMPLLARLGGVPAAPVERGVVEGTVPAARVHELEQSLPGVTRGEGVLESSFDRYERVTRGALPVRERWDHNPLNRKDYLLKVVRRV